MPNHTSRPARRIESPTWAL